jgi:hypothetical protein
MMNPAILSHSFKARGQSTVPIISNAPIIPRFPYPVLASSQAVASSASLTAFAQQALAEPVSCFPDHTLFLASPAPCCADVTPAINYYAGLDIIEVLTKCRANISGAVRSALLPRDMKQLDCDGFGNRKAR